MKERELKQKCIDCDVNLIHLEEMDKNFQKYIKKIEKDNYFPEDKLEKLKEHKSIYCPKCQFAYNKKFKKTNLKLGFLKTKFEMGEDKNGSRKFT